VLLRVLAFCAFTLTLSAADLSGIWNGQVTDRNGDVTDVSFRFAQKGEELTGKMYGDNESTPITAAKISGNQVTFTVTTELNGQISEFVYSGTVVFGGKGEGDQIQLTRKRIGGNPTGANAKGRNQNQSIQLKRVA